MRASLWLSVAAGLLASGCATWTTSDMTPSATAASTAAARAPKSSASILVTEGDITDRKYTVIGDITVTVNKTTIFHPDPTRDMVREALQKEAAAKGADAVILARYGAVGIGLFSWGSMEGKGRAVAFH